MNRRTTNEEASEAEHWLEHAILQFSSEARAPWERKEPDLTPLWKPRPSTFRFSPLRKGGPEIVQKLLREVRDVTVQV